MQKDLENRTERRGRSPQPERVYLPVCHLAQWDPESRKRTGIKTKHPRSPAEEAARGMCKTPTVKAD